MNRRFWKQVTPLFVSLAIVGGLAFMVRKWGEQFEKPFEGLVVEALPEIPDLSGWPPEFVVRLDAAHGALEREGERREALVELANLYHANGFTREAESCYLGLEGYEIQSPLWPYLLAVLRSDYRDYERQERYLERTLGLDPRYLVAYWRLGTVRLREGKVDAAEAAFQDLLEREPGSVWGRFGLAQVALARGELVEARRILEALCDGGAPLEACGDLLPTICLDLEDYEAAKRYRVGWQDKVGRSEPEEEWTRFLEEDCYEVSRLIGFAETRATAGELEAAEALLKKAWGLDGERRETLVALGKLYFGLGKPLGEGKWFPFKEVALALYDSGEDRLALAVCEGWREVEVDSVEAADFHGRLAQSIGRYEEAEAAYREAVRRAGEDNGRARLELGSFLLSWRPADGEALLEELSQSEAVGFEASYALGLYALAEERGEEAVVYFRQALDWQPGNAAAEAGLEQALSLGKQP